MSRLTHAPPTAAVTRLALVLVAGWVGCSPAGPDALSPRTSATPTACATATAPTTAIATTSADPGTARRPYGELDLDPSSFDLEKNPELSARIAESPHTYFRFMGSPARKAICTAFGPQLAGLPRVRLHGDAHVEQYAVTDLGRWLMDYDDASVGPAVIDLAHMAVSLVLGERQLGGSDADAEQAMNELLRGYADGLGGKLPPKEAPAFAKELVAKMTPDRRGFLENSEKAMALPLDPESDARARAELTTYAAAVAKLGPKRSEAFFAIKRLGAQKLGIGSAKVRRYLFRLEGPTSAADDDLMVEVKEISDVSGSPCVVGVPDGVVVERAASQKRAGLDKKLLPPMLLPDGRYWASEWLANYFEVKLKKLSKADLPVLAYETGIMLAIEHMKPLPGEKKGADPRSLAVDPPIADSIRSVARRLADESESGWKRFKTEIAEPKGTP